ncbi:MAG: DUF3737 family protein [Thomasclavelia sp.]|nr:DUF3737 family protein [Thomasclavelia sp.]
MKKYNETKYTGERPLYQTKGAIITYCSFADGESPLKESSNLIVDNCMFEWKYPFWYCNDIKVTNSTMFEMARAGVWYSNNIEMNNITYNAPKGFRKCNDLDLENIVIPDASETLWNCNNVKISNMSAKGHYFAMGCSNIEIDNLTLVGDYSFDGVKNLVIRNSKLLSKDCIWNCENVTIYDSFITGEYFGWNSKNVTLINCTIESEQGMCYMDNLVMKNCKLLNTNLAFEYSTVDATIDSSIDSVKNPISGKIKAHSIHEIIFDNDDVCKNNTEIIETEKVNNETCERGYKDGLYM